MVRIPGVPQRAEIGGFVNQQMALELLGLGVQSRGWLHSLVKLGKISAVYFDDRTLMYSRRSVERYMSERTQRERREEATR